MTKNLREAVVNWYRGPHVPPPYTHPNSGLVFVIGGYSPHWTAKAAQAVVAFWLAHWQWVIGTSIALVGLAVALKKLG
jgi:hypothetical protein